MAAEKFVTVEDTGELADVLREAERDSRLPGFDPEKALAAWKDAFGILKDDPEYNAQEENARIREWRDLDRWPDEGDE